jgi:murein DD-endopeptidase MepM/ murein hydrolase activator NlpD
VITLLGYLFTGAVFFIALVFLQNYFIDTPLEKSLKTENAALSEYKTILTAKLETSNNQLQELKAEEKDLHEKLFEEKIETTDAQLNATEEILIADTYAFDSWLTSVSERFARVEKAAEANNIQFSNSVSITRYDVPRLISTPSIAPIENLDAEKLVSGYGVRINPFNKVRYHHDGIDIATPNGTPVVATAPGRVITANVSGVMAGLGNYVDIDHGNGIISRYAHLNDMKVYFGQNVKKGEVIGTSGSSGGCIAPHLHYEIVRNGKNVNPIYYIINGLDVAQYEALAINSKKQNQSLD